MRRGNSDPDAIHQFGNGGGDMATKRAKQCEIHHWMLPAPGGPTTVGVCRNCGAEKEFSNAAARGWVPRPAAKKRPAATA